MTFTVQYNIPLCTLRTYVECNQSKCSSVIVIVVLLLCLGIHEVSHCNQFHIDVLFYHMIGKIVRQLDGVKAFGAVEMKVPCAVVIAVTAHLTALAGPHLLITDDKQSLMMPVPVVIKSN